MTDLGCQEFLFVNTINHSGIPQFTFDLLLPPSIAQDMTQSWTSQQALGGDQAQRILYNSKVCLCVCVCAIACSCTCLCVCAIACLCTCLCVCALVFVVYLL